MTIRPHRIAADLDLIAGITDTPGRGSGRPTFTAFWAAARDYVIKEAKAVGCDHVVDAAGNVHVRQTAFGWDAPAWLSGSHLDSVPHGGKFDGVTGVVVPLEILRAAADAGVVVPLELVIFAEEEGTTFNLGMLGSRAWAGTLSRDNLSRLKNKQGLDPLVAGKPYGVVADRIGTDVIDPSKYLGLIEVHVEQGPAMWEQDIPVSLVTAINGRRQFHVTVTGQNNHAGSTPMNYRRDALAGFAEMHVALEQLPGALGDNTVLTVGIVHATPNAINVINGNVTFTIDFRSAGNALLDRGTADIEAVLLSIAERRRLTIDVKQTEALPAIELDAGVIAALQTAAETAGLKRVGRTSSGALHDAAILAPLLPTAMVFVASKDGISHNPGEESRIEDIAQAAELLAAVVTTPPTPAAVRPGSSAAPASRKASESWSIAAINACSRDDFVRVVGPVFEHSPWIAARTPGPFADVADLHAKLVATVTTATDEEKLSLIHAHPDLVGRLAREGKLTRESTGEQAAAGLDALSDDEIKQFETHNAAYREKFGFPFVICARENKKDAILAAFPARLKNDTTRELAAALTEISKIARLRLNDLIHGSS